MIIFLFVCFLADNLTVDLYRAIHDGNLQSVQELCNGDEYLLEARITDNLDTALHVAVGTDKANPIVQFLLKKMSADQVLELKNNDGNTVLSIAAIVGNVKAARMIMDKQPELNDVKNNCGWIPLIEAARHGNKAMIMFLREFSQSYLQCSRDSTDKTGVSVVKYIIIAGFYKLALDLVEEYPNLAISEFDGGESLLSAIAGIPAAFPSERKLGFWNRVDIFAVLTICIAKKSDATAVKLVKFLCGKITENLDYKSASSILKRPLLLAAELGVREVVEEIITSFPDAVWFSDAKNHNAFQLAVMSRQENVFNLIFQLSIGERRVLLMSKDKDGNNILHLVGKRAPRNQLKPTCGEALQMQSELQWFQGVKEIVQPAYKEDKNNDGKTPAMVFTEEHEQLAKEGEKWMKSAAKSCSIVTALVATVVFAATITVPGGNNDSDGRPIFLKLTAFTIYRYSVTYSLLMSFISILTFLSILTVRYEEDDFLFVLPMRFMLGLLTLFLSFLTMVITSSVTVYMVFSPRKVGVSYAVVPWSVYLLYFLKYTLLPLMVEIFKTASGPGIFRKQLLYEEIST